VGENEKIFWVSFDFCLNWMRAKLKEAAHLKQVYI